MIRLAEITVLESVLQITRDTISDIYSHYYAEGVVDFFLQHHSREHVLSDIENGAEWGFIQWRICGGREIGYYKNENNVDGGDKVKRCIVVTDIVA